jgi:hypothetical protein
MARRLKAVQKEKRKEMRKLREQLMKREYIVSGATIVGAVLIFSSMCLPWFYFTGIAEYFWGTVEVSGHISAIGIGKLDRNGATVSMWSTSTYWSSAESDFWYGYLSLAGLFLVAASVIIFMKTYKTKISTLLAPIGGSIAVLAGVIATTCYKPALFIITGSIYISEYLSTQNARLYAEQATVISGLGPWLSIIGGLIPIISTISAFYKIQVGGMKRAN